MGQYHHLINLDKREFIHAHKLGDGLKAAEQAFSGPGGTASALLLLMACPVPRGAGDLRQHPAMGHWHGDRVVFVGDYAEATDFTTTPENPEAHELYRNCSEDLDGRFPVLTDITAAVGDALAKQLRLVYYGDGWCTRLRWEDAPESVREKYDGPGYYVTPTVEV